MDPYSSGRPLFPNNIILASEEQGFKASVRQGISVKSLQNVRADLMIDVGAVSQSVVVTGDAALVDTRTATVGTLVDDKRIVDLPLNERNIISFASSTSPTSYRDSRPIGW